MKKMLSEKRKSSYNPKIPKVAELPAGVSQVKFKSDLQNSPDTPIDLLALDLGLFAVLSDRTSIIIQK